MPENQTATPEEEIVLLLALMPHISSETLDLFFYRNKDYDRPYTEFGGWSGISHGGFLPTGQTTVFLLTQLRMRSEERATPPPFLIPHFSFLIYSAKTIGSTRTTSSISKDKVTGSRS
jgi:hypothetical protein